MSTKNLGPAQLELVGQLQFQSSRLTSFAPFIVGLWLDTIGLGVVLALVARWASTVSATDKITTRVLVYYLLFISLATSGYLIAMTLHQFAAGFGEYRRFLDTRWLRPAYALYALSRFPSQVFLAHRTWQMYDGNWGVPVVLAPLILTATGCGFGVAATLDQVPIPHISRQLIWAYTSSDLAADVIITSLLAYAFYSRRTGWDHTDRLITRLLRVLVETQAPPALIAVVYIIITAVAANGTELAYFAGAAKVHVACLIFVVNSRVDVRRETHGTSFSAGPGGGGVGGGVGSGSGSGNGSASANANAHKHSHSHSHALGVVSGLGRSRTGRSQLDRESIELGSTDHIRIDKHTFEVSEFREDYGFKTGINRQDSALTAPSDIELDYARRTAHADMFSDGATPPPRRQ